MNEILRAIKNYEDKAFIEGVNTLVELMDKEAYDNILYECDSLEDFQNYIRDLADSIISCKAEWSIDG